MKHREIEKAILNGIQEEDFDGTKAVTKPPVFANILFAFQPNVFNRVLFGSIRRKERTGHPPGRGISAMIERREIIHHFCSFMIGCSIPDEQKAFVPIFLTKQVKKSHRSGTIAYGVRLNSCFAILLLNRPIILQIMSKIAEVQVAIWCFSHTYRPLIL